MLVVKGEAEIGVKGLLPSLSLSAIGWYHEREKKAENYDVKCCLLLNINPELNSLNTHWTVGV